MLRTHSTFRPSLLKKHSQSLSNFILLNSKRQVQQNYQWKPLKIQQNILQRSMSVNKQISFGGSYKSKKSILVNLNSQTSQILKNQQTCCISPNKKINIESFLKSKLNLNEPGQEDLPLSTTHPHLSSKKKPINKNKMQTKINKFTNTANEFHQYITQKLNKTLLRKQKSRNQISTAQKTQNNPLLEDNLYEKVKNASLKNQRVITLISVKRYGLRMRINHSFVPVCTCDQKSHQFNHQHKLQTNQFIMNRAKQMLSLNQNLLDQNIKNIYFFHLNKDSLTYTYDLPLTQYSIVISTNPVLNNIDSQLHIKLYQQTSKIQKAIKMIQQELGIDFQDNRRQIRKFSLKLNKSPNKLTKKSTSQSNRLSPLKRNQSSISQDQRDESTVYDWQIIPSVQQFVQKACQNPEYYKNLRQQVNASGQQKSQRRQISQWCNQKFKQHKLQEQTTNVRNPLLQDHNHYPQQIQNKKTLHKVHKRLEQQSIIKNSHIYKRQPIQVLIQKVKQQKQKQQQQIIHPNFIKRNVQTVHKTKKALLRKLDQKNNLLFQQNIPYMMDKYGINRYEIHNLYNLYKTLEKISIIRLGQKNLQHKVVKKGVDRETFDEGMKRLDVNPGQQVIKNICYFDDYISWEQFIKIVSIGLRKTLQEKLEAILSGIGGTSEGFLTQNQIAIMIGTSLTKIFDSQQPELKEYFTEVAMRDLDKDGNGSVEVVELKQKILEVSKATSRGETMDLVTFLLLNS